jgi:hypothetical protein
MATKVVHPTYNEVNGECVATKTYEPRNKGVLVDIVNWRYLLIRTLTCPAPFMSNNIPYIGGKSILELVLILVVAAGSIALAFASGARGAGSIADYLGGITVVFGMRNNVLTIFGISFERALYWHKVLATFACVVSLIHGFGCEGNSTGTIVIVLMCLTSAIYFIKPWRFEIFYYFHIGFYAAIIPIAVLHKCTFFPLAAIVWAIDLGLRYLITHRTIQAEAVVLPGNVVKIQFPKTFEYEPGQYCFLMVKSLSRVEYHPFSFSSSPLDGTTSFHVRALGDWSNALLKQVQEHQDKAATTSTGVVVPAAVAGVNSSFPFVPLEICVEGPFGTPMINPEDLDYEVREDTIQYNTIQYNACFTYFAVCLFVCLFVGLLVCWFVGLLVC